MNLVEEIKRNPKKFKEIFYKKSSKKILNDAYKVSKKGADRDKKSQIKPI